MNQLNNQTIRKVNVIGAGLAGSEAAWQLAQRGIPVRLYEMRPLKYSPAHHTDGLIINNYTGCACLDLLCEVCNYLFLLFEYSVTRHLV